MPPVLKQSKRVCILFSFSFVQHIGGQAVAPDLKHWILAWSLPPLVWWS